MGELKLEDNSYSYDDLRIKYAQFVSPGIRISIDNTDITDSVMISDIEVETSVYKSGYFSFRVVNAYDKKKKDFKFDDKLAVGLSIKIELGYKNKYKTVFTGIITSVSYCITKDEGPVVNVTGYDKSFLLMKGRKSAIWQDKKHSDIVKSIADKYKLKTSITETSQKYETVVQNQLSDFEFLIYLANLNSYEFFVIGNTLYFRKINENKSSIITLTMFENIKYANIGKDIGDLIGNVKVRGYSLKKEETEVSINTISSINKSSKNGIAVINELDNKNLSHYIYEPNADKQSAEILAKSYLEKTAMNYVFGEIKITGLPELIAGRYITISGINGANSKSVVYAKSVRHTIDSDGFTTYIEIGGNSL